MKSKYNQLANWLMEKVVDLDGFVSKNSSHVGNKFFIQLQEVNLAFTNMLFQMGVGVISQNVFNELLYDFNSQINNENIQAIVDLLTVETTINFNTIRILCLDLGKWFNIFLCAKINNNVLSDGNFFYSQKKALYQAIHEELITVNESFQFTGYQYEIEVM